MLVKAPEGLTAPREPREGRRAGRITDAKEGTEVPDTVFYRRLVDEGSLILVEPAPAKTTQKEKENV